MANEGHALSREELVRTLTAYTGTTTSDGATDFSSLIDSKLIGVNDYLTGKSILILSGDALYETIGISSFSPTTGEITFGGALSCQIVAGVNFRVLNTLPESVHITSGLITMEGYDYVSGEYRRVAVNESGQLQIHAEISDIVQARVSGQRIRIEGYDYISGQWRQLATNESGVLLADVEVEVSSGLNVIVESGVYLASGLEVVVESGLGVTLASGQAVVVQSGLDVIVESGLRVVVQSGLHIEEVKTIYEIESGLVESRIQGYDAVSGDWRSVHVTQSGALLTVASGSVALISGGFVTADLISGGFVTADLISGGFVTAELISGGFVTAKLTSGGFVTAGLTSGGFVSALVSGTVQACTSGTVQVLSGQLIADISGELVHVEGYDAVSGDWRSVHVTQSGAVLTVVSGTVALISGGFVTADLISGGFVTAGLTSGGFVTADLISGGFVTAGLTSGGFVSALVSGTVALQSGGFVTADLISGGFVTADLISGGFITADLISGGFVSVQSGVHIEEVKTIYEIESGLVESRIQGYDAVSGDWRSVHVTQSGALLTVASGSVALISGGFVTADLISGGFVTADLISGGFVTAGLTSGGFVSVQSGLGVSISGQHVFVESGVHVVSLSGTFHVVVDTGVISISGETISVETPTSVLTRDILLVTNASGGAALVSGLVMSMTLKSLSGDVFVGGTAAGDMPYSGHGFLLAAGEAWSLDIDNFSRIKVCANVSGDWVSYGGIK